MAVTDAVEMSVAMASVPSAVAHDAAVPVMMVMAAVTVLHLLHAT